MDQFQSCGLVDGVGVSPVDANLEGFLRDSNERGTESRKMKRLSVGTAREKRMGEKASPSCRTAEGGMKKSIKPLK